MFPTTAVLVVLMRLRSRGSRVSGLTVMEDGLDAIVSGMGCLLACAGFGKFENGDRGSAEPVVRDPRLDGDRGWPTLEEVLCLLRAL